jgi:hypothetical protein
MYNSFGDDCDSPSLEYQNFCYSSSVPCTSYRDAPFNNLLSTSCGRGPPFLIQQFQQADKGKAKEYTYEDQDVDNYDDNGDDDESGDVTVISGSGRDLWVGLDSGLSVNVVNNNPTILFIASHNIQNNYNNIVNNHHNITAIRNYFLAALAKAVSALKTERAKIQRMIVALKSRSMRAQHGRSLVQAANRVLWWNCECLRAAQRTGEALLCMELKLYLPTVEQEILVVEILISMIQLIRELHLRSVWLRKLDPHAIELAGRLITPIVEKGRLSQLRSSRLFKLFCLAKGKLILSSVDILQIRELVCFLSPSRLTEDDFRRLNTSITNIIRILRRHFPRARGTADECPACGKDWRSVKVFKDLACTTDSGCNCVCCFNCLCRAKKVGGGLCPQCRKPFTVFLFLVDNEPGPVPGPTTTESLKQERTQDCSN